MGGQTLVHAALSLTAGHGAGHGTAPDAAVATRRPSHRPRVAADDAGGRVGSLQDHYEASVGAPAATGLSVPDPAAVLDHLPMFLAHAAAGVLVGLWLALGERAVWTLLALAVRTVLAPLAVVLLPLTPARGRVPPSCTSTRCTARRATASRAASYAVVRRPSSPPDQTTFRPASREPPGAPRPRACCVRPRPCVAVEASSLLEETHDHRRTPRPARRTPDRRPPAGLFRAFWRWHFYASFLVVPVLLVLAVTGLIYLFRFQLEPLLHADLMKVDAARRDRHAAALRRPARRRRARLPRRRPSSR